MSDSENQSVDENVNLKSKKSKKDKKKGEGKSWKKTDSEKQDITDAAEGGQQNTESSPTGLKINVVPTDIDDGSHVKSGLKIKVPGSGLTKDGASPGLRSPVKSPNTREESKLTNHT